MIRWRTILGAAVMGVLTIVIASASQIQQGSSVTVVMTSPIIKVNAGPNCTSLKSAVLKSGMTVSWELGAGVTDFHAIFPQSPFTTGKTYFDKNSRPPDLVLKDPENGEDAEDFKFVIAVDGGHTCDPHVIVIK
jgi:hypothetical protein